VDDPMYIGSPDTTFAGSRNGFSALILWEYLSNRSEEDHIDEVVKSEKLAREVFSKLKERDIHNIANIERSPFSLAIRMKLPNPTIIEKYSLSQDAMYVDGKGRTYVHIFIMRHVTEDLIDEFIYDLEKSNYFKEDKEK
jgi:histidine decarboxylase